MRAAYLTRRKLLGTLATLLAALLFSIAAASLVGPVHASLGRALGPGGAGTPDYVIIVRTRLPRVLLGAAVGASLSAAGAALQALLQNPLAEPHLLGVSSGAAVAGLVALVAGADPVSPLVPAAPFACVGLAWLFAHAQSLNLFAAGDEGALQLGIDVERARRSVFVAASLLVAAAVSVSGIIGFVGLIVPHLLRLLLGPDQRLLLPASFLGGAVFLVWADAAARTALGPAELPVGVVTALLGGPFFVLLLRRQLSRTFT